MNIKLIKAKKGDVDFLYDLRTQTMSEHLQKAGVFLSKEEHLDRIDKDFDHTSLVVQEDEKVGMIKMVEDDEKIEIAQLQVLPSFQSKGIGKTLLEDTIARAKDESKEVTLKVLKRNPAKFLYLRSGFKVVGQDKLEFHLKHKSNTDL